MEGTLQPSQLRFTPLVFICQRTPFCTLRHFQRICLELGIKDEGIGDHQGAREGFLFVSVSRTAPPPHLQQLIHLQYWSTPTKKGTCAVTEHL